MATKFITAVGRRKTATASVRMIAASKSSVMVNGKSVKDYFKTSERAKVAEEALAMAESAEHYAVAAHVEGGGIAAQADALRHAISRAIIKAEPGTRAKLKAAHFLTRDPRAKERKKPGLVKARKRKQWSKR
ncbi:30S ribosomal protein S9 [Candidatus Kaiserbacteria bacterium RIFCSPLOWO2_12_FULL_52_8]|uniref:30S ribosomal protein S9 n=1 Tax=Candidatus Kaiserbacteria bacterium RIFCSPHIGHO2_01_FULL_53_31 TaxID=1798481 RepID=A0A1F6CHZ2_9BACT|nr:MAG: 30S ribosomal protein S9 [Candidatus Kaiserbacteria bacterium RIFCSPHIGHO2_01_FULL_53_31]OGG94380.1 MAG: 30S ribosomal protein S9 [Candidatus Kaiserbacteria bacterium RIFCSPLOWO2_12_FULL_52_8]